MKYNINKDWKELFDKAGLSGLLEDILKEVEEKKQGGAVVYPPDNDIFAAFNKTPVDKVRVVILGQDPYHGPGQANGLAFSVNSDVSLPRSLVNIFKEMQDDIGGELRTNGDLSDLAEQGVLLMNSALTVLKHDPNKMSKLWRAFTDGIIKTLNESEKPIVFVLWGRNAQSKKILITNSKHHIIESVHPSPFSARKGFFKSKPFSKVNYYLKNDGFDEIKWN